VIPSTFPELLAGQLRRDGSRPLVTFYDDASGERVELSVTTFANWVAKTSGVIQDELGLERGDTVLLDLPAHWLAPVWLGACWSTGLVVTTGLSDDPSTDLAADAALVVCGPDRLDQHAATGRPVVALSLMPMGRRFTEPVPDGVVDFGVVVWGQPDAFVAHDPPEPTDAAWRGPGGASPRSQAEVVAAAAAQPWSALGTRLLTDLPPVSEAGLDAFLGPLLGGGGTVWVRHPDPAGWQRRAESEQATAVLRADQPA
jgi:uncharacterized protein (TIGR03089 family)